MTAASGPEADRATGFRPDIEGLRAVAVLLILLYHAGLPGLAGGYVGVDVFFVISGFLITSLLVRELDETGRLDLAQFYARRARRILPAALLVLVASFLGCVLFLSPVGLWRAAPDIAAAAAYVPNILFAFQTIDYFNPAHVSPVIHYWSLGVEEQFYVVWPVFLWLGHRFANGERTRLAWLVVAAVAGSLALSVFLTGAYPTAAFYLLPTRAWELGAGALVALAGRRARGASPIVAAIGAALGLGMIVASAVAFQASTPFPGTAALLPVLGTVLVIVAGIGGRAGAQPVAQPVAQRNWAAIALGTAPMRFVGRISYSLYLWHWPLLVFAGIALGGLPAPLPAGLAVAGSFALAALTYRLVEDPLRRGRLIGRRPIRNLTVALVASGAIAAVTIGGGRLATARFRQAPAAAAVPAQGDPFAGLIPATGPTADGPLPADLIPSVLNLHRGTVVNNPRAGGCSLASGQTVNGPCRFGNPASPMKVVLFGDSHVNQWWPALERIMLANDWSVMYLVKTSCTYADVTAMSGNGPKIECDTWRDAALARIVEERPATVIVSSNHRPPPIVGGTVLAGTEAVAAMQAGASRTIAKLQSTGARVVVLADTGVLPFDPADCLSSNADHVIRCAVPRAQELDLDWLDAERAAAEDLGATFVDVNAWVCPSDPCPMVIGRYAVYGDENHVTNPFALGLTSRLEQALRP
jgi:peptidoglycan/LPS O-acetylase OafA/YrhL